jgi:hypothetical protein
MTAGLPFLIVPSLLFVGAQHVVPSSLRPLLLSVLAPDRWQLPCLRGEWRLRLACFCSLVCIFAFCILIFDFSVAEVAE